MNKVRLGFFSFTEITDPGEHHSYNEWHQLDHMPEQFPLDGIAYGQRWVSTPACRAARTVSEPPLDSIHYMTLYLMTEPVERTLAEFRQLGRDLRELGRFHRVRQRGAACRRTLRCGSKADDQDDPRRVLRRRGEGRIR